MATLLLALSLAAPLPALAQNGAQPTQPMEYEDKAEREKAERRERFLLLFPAAALGITIALIIITRRK